MQKPEISNDSLLRLLYLLWLKLERRRHIQFSLILILMFISGIVEIASLGSVLPFLSYLSNPDLLWNQSIVQNIASFMHLNNSSDLLIPVTFIFIFFAILAAIIRLCNLWLNGLLAAGAGSDLSSLVFRTSLYQPYSFHINTSTSQIITTSTLHVGTCSGAINTLLQLLTSSIVSIFLIVGLFIINPYIAFFTFLVFSSAYFFLVLWSRNKLVRNGRIIASKSLYQLKLLQEGLGAIRDVILDSTQDLYVDKYRSSDYSQRKYQAINRFIGGFPRYALEGLAIVGIACIGAIMSVSSTGIVQILPTLGALALGSQRLLPSLQQIYISWASLKGSIPALQIVLNTLNQEIPLRPSSLSALNFTKNVEFRNVSFRYSLSSPLILHDISLKISPGERIGIVGTTGCGKSTFLDLLMGLLEPSSGEILIDGVKLYSSSRFENIFSWRSSIAHVPQNIFLSDSTIAENIAFGCNKNDIDYKLVLESANIAQLSSFIEDRVDGYDSIVGERGITLSGGQRQRIGIARALYKKSSLLILDEATSALDQLTESFVMSAIHELNDNTTIIMVSHRLDSLKTCDRIIKFENGSILADDSPSEVLD